MLAIITLLLIVALSLIVTRTAAVALTYTGLSQQAASLQARSAFTGVGYTTSEAESLVNHPVRRQVVMLLMLLGNAGSSRSSPPRFCRSLGLGIRGCGGCVW